MIVVKWFVQRTASAGLSCAVLLSGCGVLDESAKPAETCSKRDVLQELARPFAHSPEMGDPAITAQWSAAAAVLEPSNLHRIVVEGFDPKTNQTICSVAINFDPSTIYFSSESIRKSSAVKIEDADGQQYVRASYHVIPLADGSGSMVGFDDLETVRGLVLTQAVVLSHSLDRDEQRQESPEPNASAVSDDIDPEIRTSEIETNAWREQPIGAESEAADANRP